MHELDQHEVFREPGTVADLNPDLAHIGKDARGLDIPFPSEVRELARERRLEIAGGNAELRISFELRFGHHRLRQHRGARRLLRANDGLHALVMQSQQAEHPDTEDRNRDHHLEQRKRARAPANRIHPDTPDGITSPAKMATSPVNGENSSVITSPDSSMRCTTVASM